MAAVCSDMLLAHTPPPPELPAPLPEPALAAAEDDDALIFRYYEFEGKQTRVHLHLPEKAIRATETNLMEKDEHPLTVRAHRFSKSAEEKLRAAGGTAEVI